MGLRTNKKGFTLLEIIIVVIIVGVLASLALPRLFSTVEYSRSTEAFSALTSIRSSMERCYIEEMDFNQCAGFGNLDIQDPAGTPGAHFSYAITADSASTYNSIATRNTLDGGNNGDLIGVRQTGTSIDRCGSGAFGKIGGADDCSGW